MLNIWSQCVSCIFYKRCTSSSAYFYCTCYVDTYMGKVIHLLYVYLFMLHCMYWILCFPHADQILPKLPMPHKRLSGTDVGPTVRANNRVYKPHIFIILALTVVLNNVVYPWSGSSRNGRTSLPMSCLFVCPHVTNRLPLNGFLRNLIFELFFENLSGKFKFY